MSCPQSQQLQQLLDESLAPDQAAPLQAHVETCTACQKQIEQLAAGGVTWDKTAQHLAEKSRSDETAFLEAVDKLQNEPTSALQTQAEAVKSCEEDLSFLAPSQKPGSMGRLDEFEILSVVGKGGFGVVLKAFDENLHRIVAIKVMLPHLAANGTARERFIREAKAAAAVTHENIVTIHAVKKEGKPPYLVMQFVSGMTLNDKIDKNGPLSVKEILRIGTQIAEGLAAAHKQGLIHRDIKPGNILLENGVERVKITDFGLARAADDASVTQSGTVAGTPMYMSPEQANGEPIDLRSDLFSLGSVLYVMATGRPPFRATSTMAVMKRVCDDTPTPVQQVNAEIPAWVGDIIVKLHAKKPGDRFQSAKEVAELLGQHLADVQAGRAEGRKAPVESPATAAIAPASTSSTPPSAAQHPLGWTLLIGFALFPIFFGLAVCAFVVTRWYFHLYEPTILFGVAGGALLLAIGSALLALRRPQPFFRSMTLALGVLATGLVLTGFALILWREPEFVVVMRAEDVLPRLVGTWSIQAEMTTPPREAERGKMHIDWVANKKFLRAYAVMDNGNESLTIFSFDDRTKTFRRWFFASDAAPTSIQGPHEGHWDMKTAGLTSEGELPLFHNIRLEDHWTDADNYETRTVVTDNQGSEVIRHTKKMQRIATEKIEPKLPPGPKRPAELVAMDRQIGTWLTKADVTLAEFGGKTVQSESTSKDIAILGGRFIESHEFTPRNNRDDYIIAGYDENRKTYRIWHFSPRGDFIEADGVWNKNENKITWKSLDGRLNGEWIFPNEDERHIKMSAKDSQGRRLYEVAAVARRQGQTPLRTAPIPKLTAQEQEILERVNRERSKVGAGPLKAHVNLIRAARRQADDMARWRAMNHELEGKSPAERLKEAGYEYHAMGENLASPKQKSADEVLALWMGSQGHRQNVLDPNYTDIGVGTSLDEDGGRYCAVMFASPRQPAPEPGWVQLFNGKDTGGWRPADPDKPGNAKWTVVDQTLIGRGGLQNLMLTERSNYKNFHLRATMKLGEGVAAIILRTAPEKPGGYHGGYHTSARNADGALMISNWNALAGMKSPIAGVNVVLYQINFSEQLQKRITSIVSGRAE